MSRLRRFFIRGILPFLFVAGFSAASLAAGFPFNIFSGGQQSDEDSTPTVETQGGMEYATTPDGWKLALQHVPPAWGRGEKIPVILCHGLGYNGDFWMLSRQVNLASFLADQGYDVWILSLRGAGKSTKWVYKLAEVGMETPGVIKGVQNKDYISAALQGVGMLFKLSQAKLTNASANPKYINWTFDDYVNFDVPTAIDYVKKATGSSEVFWIGHSMGGNAVLAHLTTNQRDDLRGVVTVGSQLTMSNGHVVSQYIGTLQWLRLLELKGGVEADKAREISKAQARALLFNQNNMESDVVQRLDTSGTDTPAVGVLGQYMELLGSGQFKSSDNRFNYAQNAHNITVPILMCAGSQDSFTTAVDLAYLRDNISSEDRQMLMLGPQNGMYPFGHNDSLISRRAAASVYPVILQWLDGRMALGSAPPAPAAGYQAGGAGSSAGGSSTATGLNPNKPDKNRPMKALPASDFQY